MDEHHFYMATRMMKKLLGCHGHYSEIKLNDKYQLLDNFLLHSSGHFDFCFGVHIDSCEDNPKQTFPSLLTKLLKS
jgi:hypothetical protein